MFAQLPIPMPDKLPTTADGTIVYLLIAWTIAGIGIIWLMFAFIQKFYDQTRTDTKEMLAGYKADSQAARDAHAINISKLGADHKEAVNRVCTTFESTIAKITGK